MKIPLVSVLVCILAGCAGINSSPGAAAGSEETVLGSTLSPDGKTVIVSKLSDSGRAWYFRDTASGKNVGLIAERSRLDFVTSWNCSGTKVALVGFYHTKLSGLWIFARDAHGEFKEVALEVPDPEALYHQQSGKALAHPGDGHSENGVGPWVDDDTVRLVAGNAVQAEQNSEKYIRVYATFKARIEAGKAVVSEVELVGPMSDESGEAFIVKWGKQYFETSGEE